MSISRRAYLSAAALAASSVAIAKTSGAARVGRLASGLGLTESDLKSMVVLASDLEVITVTDTSVAFTWATYAPGVQTAYGFAKPTVPAGQKVLLAPADGGELKTVYEGFSESGYHHVMVEGLEPGRAYRFECWSDGSKALPSLGVTMNRAAPECIGEFTTLPALEGQYLATFALTNDTHIGKPNHDGIRIGNFGLSAEPGDQPFSSMQLDGLLKTVSAAGIDTIVVNGDCTDSNRPEEYTEFLRVMNGFGDFGKNWFVTRGNHDNHPPGLPNINGRRGRDIRRGKTDIPDYFSEHLVPTQQHWATNVGEVRLMGLDTAEFGYAGGRINERQMRAVRAELASDPDRPTILFAHHPLTRDAVRSHIGGPAFMMDWTQSKKLQEIAAATPGVKGIFAGHTHRSRRGIADVGSTDFCERGASLGYPGGYTRIRVHTDGYQVSFHRTTTPESLLWSTKTRWSMFGLEPELMLGKVSDRNYVHKFANTVAV
ncbi:purple acid phosphatase family protein [Corynebacterium lactis]|nr:metallophosphoesterase family protein [Corynebacterium lactis]